MPTDSLGVPGYARNTTVLASSGYTTDQAVDVINHANRGMHVILDVSVKTGAPTNIILTVKAYDPASGELYTLLAGAAVTGVSTNVYKIFPKATAAANAVANDVVPRQLEISVAGTGVTGAAYFTYSVAIAFMAD